MSDEPEKLERGDIVYVPARVRREEIAGGRRYVLVDVQQSPKRPGRVLCAFERGEVCQDASKEPTP